MRLLALVTSEVRILATCLLVLVLVGNGTPR